MVSGVLVGLLALGEALPRSGARRLLRLISWVLILLGVTNLSSGSAEGEGGGGGSGGGGGGGGGGFGSVMRRLEEAVRGAHWLPHSARLWLLGAVLAVAESSKRLGRGGSGGSGKGSSLLSASSGHGDGGGGGPALPIVSQAAAASEGPGGAGGKDPDSVL